MTEKCERIIALHEQAGKLWDAMRCVRLAEYGEGAYGRNFENEGAAGEEIARLRTPLANAHRHLHTEYENRRTDLFRFVKNHLKAHGEAMTVHMLYKLKHHQHPLGHSCWYAILEVLRLQGKPGLWSRLCEKVDSHNPYLVRV